MAIIAGFVALEQPAAGCQVLDESPPPCANGGTHPCAPLVVVVAGAAALGLLAADGALLPFHAEERFSCAPEGDSGCTAAAFWPANEALQFGLPELGFATHHCADGTGQTLVAVPSARAEVAAAG